MELRKEYTEELKVIIPESLAVAASQGLDAAIELLLGFEKKTRLANDFANLKEVCLHMVRLCREKNDWQKLNSVLSVIDKRRSQSKTAILAVVEEAYTYLEHCPTLSIKTDLATTLKEVCEGKIYVEAKSAFLHMMLAHILEEKGDIGAACDMIQDVHVETYGAVSRLEKQEYVLEQIRLNLKRKDYVRAMIQSRKMTGLLKSMQTAAAVKKAAGALAGAAAAPSEGDTAAQTALATAFASVKVKFYTMMVEYYSNAKDAWEICQCYYNIYDTKTTQADPAAKNDALESCVIFLILSKFTNHASDMLYRLKSLPDVKDNALCTAIIGLFTTPEIIPYPFAGQDILEAHACFVKPFLDRDTVSDLKKFFRLRVIEHNLRTFGKVYKRMHMATLGQMLALDADTLEKHLSDMSSSGDLYLKIDRPKGIVSFVQPVLPETVLSDWSSDMGKLLGLMENTCHLINRERMVHRK